MVCWEVPFCRQPLDIAVGSLSMKQFDAISHLFQSFYQDR